MMNRKDALYHACRISFNVGKDNRAGWPRMLETLRGVLSPQHVCRPMTEEEYKQYPELAELRDALKAAVYTKAEHIADKLRQQVG